METDANEELSNPQAPISSNAMSGKNTVKQLIESYFKLMTEGCGNPQCSNQYCCSSPKFFKPPSLSPNEAAVEAIKLTQQKVIVHCTPNLPEAMEHDHTLTPILHAASSSSPSAGVASTSSASTNSASTSFASTGAASTSSASTGVASTSSTYHNPPLSIVSQTVTKAKVGALSESLVLATIQICKQEERWSELVKLIGSSFSQMEVLLQSFRLSGTDVAPGHSLDLDALRSTYTSLFSVPDGVFNSSLVNAIINLSTDLSLELQYRSAYERDPHIINIILIILNLPCLDSPEYIEKAYPAFLKAVSHLPLQGQKFLVQLLVSSGPDYLCSLLTSLQQLITIRVVSQSELWNSRHLLNKDEEIASAAKVMKFVYYASIIGGRVDDSKTLAEEKDQRDALRKSIQEFIQSATERSTVKERTETKEDPLAQALGIRHLDCREPLIPRLEFVNDMINDTLEMDQDFAYYRAQADTFTFIRHSFLLSTATKSMAMYYDNRIRMINERRSAILSSLMHGGEQMPYLRLRIRRDHLIDDALIGLEMVFMDNPDDLKKQLYVEFEGEQGIDEGGVSKEFFQLITEEIFNPDFGMFIYDEDTRLYWFNADSFENDAQFTLVGILLGLAIYNNIILDARLPMVVYRKLMGKLGVFEDMKSSHPVLYSSLKQMLDYDGDVEQDFMISFCLSRKNVFGEVVSHPLKENGSNITVNNENRPEYCSLYSDYLLNKMISKQFHAFFRGFHMVTDESPLETLFTPEEVEELVCGSSDWDIQALEDSTEYDGGFDSESETVKHFWQVVHRLSVENQRKLLQFISGCDRVPVGGLAKLKLVIAKNGPDSERLPTSHTCFNVLLLPDYKNLDKLTERLMLAITHAKGFGML